MDGETYTRFKNLIIDELRNINAFKETDINNGMGKQLATGVPLPFCDKLTASYPIICFLDNLYDFLLDFIIEPIIYIIGIPLILLFLLAYILVNWDWPPTFQSPPTFECCQP